MWWYVAFYVVTAALSYALTPRPKKEQRRPVEVQQAQAPQARTSGAIPVVFGTVWVVPNVVDWSSPRAEEIIECVKSGKK